MLDRTVLVVGATGAQGGSVARHLLSRGTFRVRALTRNPESPAAQALRDAGADVVKGELADRASLRCALKGVYGAFGVTNYWEHFEREQELGRNLVNAVAGSEVEHFVFSSLPGVAALTGGELHVPHFDQKHELERYTQALGIPATFVHVAFYFDNFFTFFPPRADAEGKFRFGFPQGDVPLAGVAAEDIGGVVAGVFEYPAELIGTTVGVVGDDLRGSEYADVMSRVAGKPVQYDAIPREVFAAFPFKGAGDLADMFTFNQRYIPQRTADLERSRDLYPQMQSFAQWAERNSNALQSLFV